LVRCAQKEKQKEGRKSPEKNRKKQNQIQYPLSLDVYLENRRDSCMRRRRWKVGWDDGKERKGKVELEGVADAGADGRPSGSIWLLLR
jgi:hypothetical protein